ncbi:MAG: hypothetical protein JNM76_14720 [Betaproteobacteria bacterium]|nr:hypothetical protein [Betaproteobacteria bacterium]
MPFGAWVLLIVGAVAAWLYFSKSGKAEQDRYRYLDDQPTTNKDVQKFVESAGSFFPIRIWLDLDYIDAQGTITRRRVRTYDFSTDGPGMINAHCELRNGYRSFRMDRVRQAIVMESGETAKDVKALLIDQYRNHPDRGFEAVLADHLPTVRALLYLGKADGQFSTKEREIVVELCNDLTGRTDLTRESFNQAIRSLEVPSKAAFWRITGELAKQPEALRAKTLRTAERMVATQKKLEGEELEAITYLRNKLS